MNKQIILMPRIGTNDDYVMIGSWYVENGEKVTKGQPIVSLETTKETVEFISEYDGYIFYQHKELDEVEVGKQLAVIADSPDFKFELKASDSIKNINMTRKARELVDQYGLDISSLDRSAIIRASDVKRLLSNDFTVERSKANDVIIVAGGGLAKMCIDLINLSKSYNIHGILDNGIEAGEKILEIPVIGPISDLLRLRREGYLAAVNAIGSIGTDNLSEHFQLRKKIFSRIKGVGFYSPTLIHPSAQVSPFARIGEGTIVMENAVIGPGAVIGNDVIINTGGIISHDCVIGDHVRISPGAILAGNVKVGENALVGMGVTVYLGIEVGKNAIISNGKNIFGNVADNAIIK